MNVDVEPWRVKISRWFRVAKTSTRKGTVIGLLLVIITWRLWLQRCKARMERDKESVEVVWLSMRSWLVIVANGVKRALSYTDQKLLEELQVRTRQLESRTPHKVVWEKPPVGWLKLNVDGSCRGNPGSCGGGGIIRDSYRNMKAAFSKKLELGTNNGVELRAITSGVRHSKEMGYQNICIESDLELVVS
ncbi:uncharacterized protein LOC121240828 [Juglans microcarpa x Juglans regia]|uniref:uncharacterized protein LOC121240828 n=1 Tax=Juglans microcarpa x Juglans regia TaxID=2249226 RepID=UPI001B7EEC8B|nr:uncharacterized protein LOC121240828 [Juglans microcarpa x Juglans regia]